MIKKCVRCKQDTPTAWINTKHVCEPCYWKQWRLNKGIKPLYRDEEYFNSNKTEKTKE